MPEAQTSKSTFDLSGGLNTEINEMVWPDGFTTAEANYELLADGTRRRRKGLAAEASAGSAQSIDTMVATQAHQQYKWKTVNGDPTKSFIVHQIGKILYFTNDDTNPSASWATANVDLEAHAAESSVTLANIRDQVVRFTQGRGHLFVTGPYLKPFYVKWDSGTSDFITTEIPINYRDFDGINDGIDVAQEPVGTITADHRYNLRNRGWPQGAMDTVFADNAVHPAKNGVWHSAYERTIDTTTDTTAVEVVGTRALNTTKYNAEVFGNSSAPQGSLFLNPFDTTFANFISGAGVAQDIESFTLTPPATTLEITITGHGYSDGDSVTISGQASTYLKRLFGVESTLGNWDYNGTYTVANKTANTFEITVVPPYEFISWVSQNAQLGWVGSGVAIAKSDGSVVERGFQAIGFYAGRVWYAGLADSQFADHVFFSRICQNPINYGECHQRQDPTDENFNDLTAADGGVLIVPGMNGIVDMMNVGTSLVLVGTEGAWEISGGRGTVFTATRFGVKQLTNANLNSATGTLSLDDGGVSVGPSGIYLFGPNQFTGLLEANNMIKETIQTKWNGFTTAQQQRCQVAYDDSKNRIYFMLGATAASNAYTDMLIFDTKKAAWYVYTFAPSVADTALLSMVAISDADDSSDNQKMKFLYQATPASVQIADFQQSDYLDFDGNESPLPFMMAGYDNIGEFQRRKQAPIITVFSRRTETGYNAALDAAVNESSTLMTALWDWTELVQWDSPSAPTAQETADGTTSNYGVSGKIGARNEVYRHVRKFVPLSTSDVDGYPVVVTRNKVRGRGRVLQLRFEGAATKDSHIIGWATNYKVSERT